MLRRPPWQDAWPTGITLQRNRWLPAVAVVGNTVAPSSSSGVARTRCLIISMLMACSSLRSRSSARRVDSRSEMSSSFV